MNRRSLNLVLQLVGIGWYVGICLVGGVLLGLWVDEKTGLLPLFTLLGLLLGLVLAFYGMYRMVLPLIQGPRDEK